MIYLTFDSNIWIYLLDDAWKDSNPLDILEHWIDEGQVKILLPRIIVTEWAKHREVEKGKRVTKLKEFFSMAEEIFSSAFIGDQRNPENIKRLVENQFERIENLIKVKSEIIEISEETKAKVIGWGILKKAPMHKKSSIADALIIFSLFEYAAANPDLEYIFISANVDDFYEKINGSHQIHKDLKDAFDNANIKDYKNLSSAIGALTQRLPMKIDIGYIKKQKRINKDKGPIYNPSLVKTLGSIPDVYLENTKILDLVLKSPRPTKQQILSVLGIIDSDESHKDYFYRKVDATIWFEIFKQNGIFDPSSNPDPINVNGVVQIPIWYPLSFLEKISIRIREGYNAELISEILKIIDEVSLHPKDNYRTWYWFIKILKNLPNESIPTTTLDFIPVWLSGRFDARMQSAEIINELLPKYLIDSPTVDDSKKLEIILRHLLEIRKDKKNKSTVWENDFGMAYIRASIPHLVNVLNKPESINKIVRYCSTDFILYLATQIKKLLIDYPNGLSNIGNDGINEFQITVLIGDTNLTVLTKVNETVNTSTLVDFERLDNISITEKIDEIVNGHGINYVASDSYKDITRQIILALNTDLNTGIGSNAIHKLGKKIRYRDKPLELFALVFRDLLTEKISQNLPEAKEIITTIFLDHRFKISFFRRVAIYAMGKYWAELGPLFWKLINKDFQQYFSDYIYTRDLYYLLTNNQSLFTSEERIIIEDIIENGPQNKEERSEKSKDYWKLKWNSALKNTSPFREKYNILSEALNITEEDYENSEEMTMRSGTISPFTMEAFSQLNNEEIVNYIKSFTPKDRWEEPNIEGLSDMLGKAVEENPDKFATEIELYKNVPYIYSYHLINGLRDAWKKSKSFKWDKVLNFCRDYILSETFYTNQLELQNDGWNAKSDWVVGAIANLLSEGTRHDENAFEPELLPITKDILSILVKKLEVVDDFGETKLDYPTYSLNSTAGKVLRALLDYSLRRTRIIPQAERWESEVKHLFEETFEKGIIDGYIIEGMYFDQFYYLDEEWIRTEVGRVLNLPHKAWLAFLGGLAFGNAPSPKNIYEILKPHYERALQEDIELTDFYDNGLIRHLVAFYFWGYEDLDQTGLIINFVNKANAKMVLGFVNYLAIQEEYQKTLEEEERNKFDANILRLWSLLTEKYSPPTNEDEEKILAGLSRFLVYVRRLDGTITGLILESSEWACKHYQCDDLIENLTNLSLNDFSVETPQLIGKILTSLSFNDYLSSPDTNNIVKLVTFLYENGQKDVADNFCNKMSKQGYEFVNEIYNRFN